MVFNYGKFFTFLAVLPFFFPNHFFYLIFILPSVLFFINKCGVKIFISIILSLIFGCLFFFRDYIVADVDYSNFKMVYLFSSLFLAWGIYKKNYVDIPFLRDIFIFYTLLNFFVLILQFLTPSFFIWSLFYENEGQYASFLDGRMFGFSGNPTHSGYLTMLTSFFLISLREKIIYIAISLVSVILLLNKMSILVLLVFGFLLYCIVSERYLVKFSVLTFGFIVSLLVIYYVIFPYFQRWAEVGYDTHTITYRVEVYEYIFNNFKNSNYFFWGDPAYYSIRSTDAFDSLPALIVIKFGVLLFIFLYILIFILTPKNSRSIILFLSLVIPSFTMMAFYNTLYTFSIFILYFSTISVLNKRK